MKSFLPQHRCCSDISGKNDMKPKITNKPENQWMFASRTAGGVSIFDVTLIASDAIWFEYFASLKMLEKHEFEFGQLKKHEYKFFAS